MEGSDENSRLDYNRRMIDEHLAQDASRFARIEQKLDKITDTLIALARAEEKLLNLERHRNEMLDLLDNHEERLDHHETRLNAGAVTIGAIQKVFWILLAGTIPAAIGVTASLKVF
jgi:ABC-type Fe3+-citrate transport system substrate-binding protein